MTDRIQELNGQVRKEQVGHDVREKVKGGEKDKEPSRRGSLRSGASKPRPAKSAARPGFGVGRERKAIDSITLCNSEPIHSDLGV